MVERRIVECIFAVLAFGCARNDVERNFCIDLMTNR
jgi:hypothetical protein